MTVAHGSARAALCFALIAGCCVSGALATGLDYQIVWSDEFDGTSVDTSKWEFQIGNGCPDLCGWGNNELQYYRAENASVSGGQLTITAREQSFAGYDYTSARLRTLGQGDWTYGRIEMRAKMPIGQGIWPAFWMLPTDWVYGGWAASGEIDVMEYLGHEPEDVFGTIHYGGAWPDNFFSSAGYSLPSGTFHDDFHVFAVEWEPHEMRWYVDDTLYRCESHWTSTAGDYPAPFDKDFHLLMNTAVGGFLPGEPDATTDFPQEYVVDYVRVYQKPEFPECEVLFDGMDHADPFGNDWFIFDGVAGGGIGVTTTDIPGVGCDAGLTAGWGSGGTPGFFGGFGRNARRDLSDKTHFSFWINPDPGQQYTIEINLQDDDNGDDGIGDPPDGIDDEYQFDCVVGPSGPCAIAGGGWQRVSIPFTEFYDDNSYHYGGNGVFDPVPTGNGGNGQLVAIVLTLISPGGANVTFRTDKWMFTQEDGLIGGRVWSDGDSDGSQDGGEPGLDDVVVELLDSGSTVVESTTTASDGTYQFASLPWDGYTVAIRTDSLPAGAVPTADPDGTASPHAASLVLGCADTSSANDFGYGVAPVPPPTTVTASRNPVDPQQIDIGYATATCNASDHTVLFGQIGDFSSVTAADCSIGNGGSVTSTPPAGDVWLLVVGREGNRYSSAGQSTGGERTPSGVGAECPALSSQDLSASCP